MRLLALCAALALGGCSEAPDSTATVPWPETELVLEEELRLDGMELEFDRVTAVAIAEDGQIAVADGGVLAVRIFGPGGELRATVGREGQGPGEFTSLRAIGWLADSLWAFDGRQLRYTVFGPDLEFVRTVTVPPVLEGGDVFAPVVGLLSGDTVVVSYDDGALAGFRRMRPDGAPLEEFARHAASPYRVPHETGAYLAPYWPQTHRALSPDGRTAAILRVNVEGPAAGTLDVATIETRDTLFSRRYRFEPERVPGELAARAASQFVMAVERSGGAARAREIGAATIYPPTRELLVGRDGSLWLRMRETPEGQPYRAIDADGSPLGTLLLAEGDRMAAAERGRVWVYEHDALDVRSVVQYKVGGEGSGREQ